MRIAFFGSDRFSVRCLEAFLSEDITSTVSIFYTIGARESFEKIFPKLPIHKVPQGTLRGWEFPPEVLPFDLGIVASFGHFVPKRIIDIFSRKMINAHPSLLPAYRGASPIQHTIMDGRCDLAGVSIIEVHPQKMDAGRIILQEKFKSNFSAKIPSFRELEEDLGILAGKLLAKVTNDFESHMNKAVEQNENLISIAPKITKDLGFVKFNQMSSRQIYSRYQAIGHQEPIFCLFRETNQNREGTIERRVQLVDLYDPIINTRPLSMGYDQFREATYSCMEGSIFLDRQLKALWVMTASRDWLPIRRLRLVEKSTVLDAGAIVNTLGLRNFCHPYFV